MYENLYPLSPAGLPEGFTHPGAQYKKQVVYVLGSMLLFMMLYLAMISGAAYLVYISLTYPLNSINKLTILLKLGAIAMAVMLFAFLLKFLFKRHETNSPLNIEITEQEHPLLFTFIRQLCRETGAPFPHKVYVNHEINACVFYDSTVLSLFLPVKKNLLIGLGLVNSVNLSEFKAVLAHEFGHFAQSSMKLGSYVYMANRIIHCMVHERDKWDELLEQWKNTDFRLAVFAWLLLPVVWVIRKSMNLIYGGINLVHASLSRQMEFNADKVAISVSGSDAIINALYKLGPASEAFDFSNSHLSTAADQKLYTTNLFYHHNKAVEHLSKHRTAFRDSLLHNRLKTTGGRGLLFTQDDVQQSGMYASHPSNYMREQNAKAPFVAAQADERSPWLLFNQPEALAEGVSINLLRINLQLPHESVFSTPEQVQAFLEAELAETTYGEQYRGVYTNRFITHLDLQKEVGKLNTTTPPSAEELQQKFNALYGPAFAAKMKEIERRHKDLHTLSMLLQQHDEPDFFILADDKEYPAEDAKKLFEALVPQFEAEERWYKQWDQQVFRTYYLLAAHQPCLQQDLLGRYQFHMEWQRLYKQMLQLQKELQDSLHQLLEKGSFSEDEVKVFADKFRTVNVQLEGTLSDADKLTLPQLNNLQTFSSVRSYLLEEPVAHVYSNSLEGQQINRLTEQTALVIERMRRVHFKSMGGILSVQEKIAADKLLINGY